MKKIIFSGMMILTILFFSCKEQTVTEQPGFSGQLTEAEIQNGRLTPEILWKFGRVTDAQISPDGSTVIYNVTRYDAVTNKSITDIYMVHSNG